MVFPQPPFHGGRCTTLQRFQHFLDKATPYVLHRWIAFLCIAFLYVVRVLLLGVVRTQYLHYSPPPWFPLPEGDPELCDAPTLPIRGSYEFRPFVRRLPEFKFWLSITRAFCIGFVLTFSSLFDVPVFWPLLIFYWVMLFVL